VPASFEDQLAIAEELLRDVDRMARAERRAAARRPRDAYERELRLAGLAQRIAQAYTLMEGVLAYVARRIDRVPPTGADWHKKLIARCAQPFDRPRRAAVLSAPLAADLLELCEFRHVVRSIYPTRLDETRVRQNLALLVRAAPAFGAETRAFAASLAARGRVRRRRQGRRR
jgi:hypothetical protein